MTKKLSNIAFTAVITSDYCLLVHLVVKLTGAASPGLRRVPHGKSTGVSNK
jgi:hypothetical protein